MRFRGKERIKDLVRLLRRQAYAGIADRHHELLILRPLRFDGEFARPASIFHTIDGIQHKVHEHLLPLHTISCDLGAIVRALRSDSDGLTHSLTAHQPYRLSNDL